MKSSKAERPLNIVTMAVQAFTLYSLAEFHSGHATTIKITVDGSSFGIADNGRGHSIPRVVDGTSYLQFIYTHFDYPFESGVGSPVQLQGLGMSLINAMCSELSLTVKNREETLELFFRDGQLDRHSRTTTTSNETGNTIVATIDRRLPRGEVSTLHLESWLLRVLATSPSLKLFFNGRELRPHVA